MDDKKEKNTVPFDVMAGDSKDFSAAGKKFKIKPMLVGDALKFIKDNISIGPQLFNLTTEESRENIDKYLNKYCTDCEGNSMSLEKVSDWNLNELQGFIRELSGISG